MVLTNDRAEELQTADVNRWKDASAAEGE